MGDDGAGTSFPMVQIGDILINYHWLPDLLIDWIVSTLNVKAKFEVPR